MTLTDDFNREGNAIRRGPECRVGQLLEYLNEEDRQILLVTLADSLWPSTKISKVLVSRASTLGEAMFRVNPATIGRHRKGDCRCGK